MARYVIYDPSTGIVSAMIVATNQPEPTVPQGSAIHALTPADPNPTRSNRWKVSAGVISAIEPAPTTQQQIAAFAANSSPVESSHSSSGSPPQ